MGACVSSSAKQPPPAPDATEPRSTNTNLISVVLIGQGESGKSTIFKQMRVIQAKEEGTPEWSHDERLATRHIVWSNAVSQMRLLVRVAMEEAMDLSSPEVTRIAAEISDTTRSYEPNAETAAILKALWAEEAIRMIYGERDRLFNISDGVAYFWHQDNIDRVFSENYLPTNEDMLRVRLRTVGFEQAIFSYKGSRFRVVDVGGQRSERAMWAPQIDQATCVLFVSALTEYDQHLREDFSQSRMSESLHLWTELIDVVSATRKELAVVLLLNKLDLFMEKFRGPIKGNFQRYFKKYIGKLEWAPCASYIKDVFLAISSAKQLNVTVHLVSALEMDSVRLLWQDVRDMLRDRLLKEFNLI